MSAKNPVTNWFNLVKTAKNNRMLAKKSFDKMIEEYKKVCLVATTEENPKFPYDSYVGQFCCVARYALADWKETLNDCDPGETVHSCPNFTMEKCAQNCKMKEANHVFIDAQQAYIRAKKEYKDSVKRVFGIKVK